VVASQGKRIESETLAFKGRRFEAAELALVRDVVCGFPGLSRQELAATVCELLGWQRPNGGSKVIECRELLELLAARGELTLPAPIATKPRGAQTRVPVTVRGDAQEPVVGTVGELAPVLLRRVATEAQRLLWRELVGRYHYLGHTMAFGAHLRYLVEVSRPMPRVVGCLQVSSPAWKMAPRDRWIGWTPAVRERNLQRIVNNSRFLLLPWVQVSNLASAVLAQMARQMPGEWESAYRVRPLLLETLVDRQRFAGTCYRAANWLELGITQGRGRQDRFHARHGECPKTVLVYPLVRRARELLGEAS
jgi:hypothetical protein